MTNQIENLKQILEAALFAVGEPTPVDKMVQLFDEAYQPSAKEIKEALKELQGDYLNRGIELVEVASGYRFQSRVDYSPWLKKLWEKKPPRYSRALLETLALIIYKQPITRGEIEDVRGVAVSTNIIKTLMDREWIKVAGYKEVPGKPALFATTKIFLDYFNLKSISDLPALDELTNFEEIEKQLGTQLMLNINEDASANTAEGIPEGSILAHPANDERVREALAVTEEELNVDKLLDRLSNSGFEEEIEKIGEDAEQGAEQSVENDVQSEEETIEQGPEELEQEVEQAPEEAESEVKEKLDEELSTPEDAISNVVSMHGE